MEGSLVVNDVEQKKAIELIPEVVVSLELSTLSGGAGREGFKAPNFIGLERVTVCRGCYPGEFMRAGRSRGAHVDRAATFFGRLAAEWQQWYVMIMLPVVVVHKPIWQVGYC